MLAAKQDSRASTPQIPLIGRTILVSAVLTLAVIFWPELGTGLLTPPHSRAADQPARTGLFLSVPNPITPEVVTRIRTKIEDARTRQNQPLKKNSKIIFDFNPTNAPSGTPDPYPCLDLADYLSDLKNQFYTVAFVHHEVTQHTVLPVLACREIVMSDNAEIGDVLKDQQRPLSPRVRNAYEDIAGPEKRDLVRKMLDKDLGILKGKTGKGDIRYLGYKSGNREKVLERARAEGGFKEVTDVMPPGTSRYKARDARACGLCYEEFMNSRDRVIRANGLSPASLREDILQGQTLHPWLIEFSGAVTEARINSVRRKVDKAISKGGNFLILQLDCETGTDTQAARDFAEYLRKLKDDKGVYPVKTVAYIPPRRSLGAATFIALGCNEIIMAKDSDDDKETALGDFSYLKEEKPESYEMKRKALVGLAQEQWYSPLLVQATMDKDLVLLRVESKADPGYHVLVSEKEFNEDKRSKQPKWNPNHVVPFKHKGEFLRLDAKTALSEGIARKLVDDLDGLYRHYGIKRSEVRTASADVLDDIEQFFRYPLVRMLLVMLGIIGLILEMKMPGIGVPGVIAAVCFVLYFWSNSSLGHFTWLAILLFVLGLILICLEVFFLPGMAVFGISGIILVVSSLILVTLEKAPTTTKEWWSLGGQLSYFTAILIGGITVAFLIARYLPQIPYANRLVLTPPAERPEPAGGGKLAGETERRADLLGAIGEAATTLRPAGKARFGDQFLDVIAEGSYVSAGNRVQVIEIEGNRIVVKEV